MAALCCLPGCGNDGKGSGGAQGGGEGGSHAGPSGSCRSFCEAEHVAACGLYESVGSCVANECRFEADASDECLDAIEAFYDCTQVAIETCNDVSCVTETEGLRLACN